MLQCCFGRRQISTPESRWELPGDSSSIAKPWKAPASAHLQHVSFTIKICIHEELCQDIYESVCASCPPPPPLEWFHSAWKDFAFAKLLPAWRTEGVISWFVPALLSSLGVCGYQLFFVGCPSVRLTGSANVARNMVFVHRWRWKPKPMASHWRLIPSSQILETGSENVFNGLFKIIAVVTVWVKSTPLPQ